MANGFTYGDCQWVCSNCNTDLKRDYHARFKANLGQGAPEVGEIPDAPPRITKFEVPIDALEYAPTTGVKAFRHAVANLYNMQYRQNKACLLFISI